MQAVDASVFGQVVFDEPQSPAARAVLAGSRVVAPPSLRVELANLVRRLAKAGRWGATRAVAVFDDLCETVDFAPDSDDLGRAALALAIDMDHAAQDCAYLALARMHGLPLYTADAAFARKARAKGHDVRTP